MTQTSAPMSARDIPPMYPFWYEVSLDQALCPVTPANVLAVADFARCIVGAYAILAFQETSDEEARQRWSRLYSTGRTDVPQLLRRADAMRTFLWNWSPRTHQAVLDFPEIICLDAAKAARQFGPNLPLNMWGRWDG